MRASRRARLAYGTLCVSLVAAGTASAAQNPPPQLHGVVTINVTMAYQSDTDSGAGLILSNSGEVLTNNHLIRGATAIRVTDTANGHTYSATVTGYDPAADIAVLQLKGASSLQTVSLENSAKTKIGDRITLPAPAGMSSPSANAETGKITALNQSFTAADSLDGGPERLAGMTVTNVLLSSGTLADSGGPMLNSVDQVIGMVTASSNGSAAAIPINTALSVAAAIEAGRSSEAIHVGGTAFLGVAITAIGKFNNGPKPTSVVVANAIPSSPVAKAGITAGDVLTALDGQKINSPTRLATLLLTKKPGTTAQLAWTTNTGATHHATVRLASGPPQ